MAEVLVTSAVLVTLWVAYDQGRTSPAGRGASRRAATLFAAGLVVVGVTLLSPLDTWAERSLTAHMVQHLLLLAVAPPLLVAAAPGGALAAGVPVRWRPVAARLERLTRPAGVGRPSFVGAAVAVELGVVLVWHLPACYDAALRHQALHAAEHASFLAAGVAFWWSVIGLRRRSAYGVGVIALFVMALVTTALGAAMTLATDAWYGWYGAGAGAVDDQHLAGVIMWAWGGLISVVSAVSLFALWLSGYERTSPGWPREGRGLA